MTINYGIFGQQFHFEKSDPSDPVARYGCYGQPNRETTYYIANSNGYQTLQKSQFDQVAHIFPSKCSGSNSNVVSGSSAAAGGGNSNTLNQQNVDFKQRTARLLADNQRMAHNIQSKLTQEGSAMQPTMVLLVPFCPNTENEALSFLQQWRDHATPVNVAGYLFSKDQ